MLFFPSRAPSRLQSLSSRQAGIHRGEFRSGIHLRGTQSRSRVCKAEQFILLFTSRRGIGCHNSPEIANAPRAASALTASSFGKSFAMCLSHIDGHIAPTRDSSPSLSKVSELESRARELSLPTNHGSSLICAGNDRGPDDAVEDDQRAIAFLSSPPRHSTRELVR